MTNELTTHTFTVIGEPEIKRGYCDKWETAMEITLRRNDGVEGTIWVMAGVPPYQQGSSTAAGHRYGFEDVRNFGDFSLEEWCDEKFCVDCRNEGDGRVADWMRDDIRIMLETVKTTALANQIDYETVTDEDDEN